MSSDELKSASNHDVLSEWVFNLGFIQALAQGFVSLLFLFFCAGIRKSQFSIFKVLGVIANMNMLFRPGKKERLRIDDFSFGWPAPVASRMGGRLPKSPSTSNGKARFVAQRGR